MNKFSKSTPLIGSIPDKNFVKEEFNTISFDIDFVVTNVELGKYRHNNQLYFLGKSYFSYFNKDKEIFYLFNKRDSSLESRIKNYYTLNEVKINFIGFVENLGLGISKPDDEFDLRNDKINIYVNKETMVNIHSNLKIDHKTKLEKLGTLEIITEKRFSTFQSNFKDNKQIVCVCEKEWLKEGNFSKKDDIKLLDPNSKISGWNLTFQNIFEGKKNKGFFRNLFN